MLNPSETLPVPKLLASLRTSGTFRSYRQAFKQLTGLTPQLLSQDALGIRSLTAQDSASASTPSFCALMARRSPGCLSCLEEERAVVSAMHAEPAFFGCFAGLRRVVVPVRAGDKLFAVLQAGPLLSQSPTSADLNRLTRQLRRRKVEPSQQTALREALRSTVVVSPAREGAAVGLLQVFAEHLGLLAAGRLEDTVPQGLSVVDQAVGIIRRGGRGGPLPLGTVARAVGLSTRHFSEVFHRSTGETFTHYLARVRVENAQQLLGRSSLRISEVATRSGFGSLSQFNRTFLRQTGQSPKAYRAEQRRGQEDH